jgi:NAD(P)-dependent dehydrogenase (short-subunit alcohol dehydrogenase family)
MSEYNKNNSDIYDIFSVADRVAIVTGAARGSGLAISMGLARAGAFVYGIDLLDPEIKDGLSGLTFFKTDIRDKASMEKIINKIVSERGRIDILVNNAAITRAVASETYAEDDWNNTVNTNLYAPFMVSQLVFKPMKDCGGGAIINITSLNTKFGFSNNPAYVSSKSGLGGLTKSLAKDWAKFNIRVNSICPGYIHTDMTKISFNDPTLFAERMSRAMIKRYGEPDDLVGSVIFLSSAASSYITGSEICVDGGWSSSGI